MRRAARMIPAFLFVAGLTGCCCTSFEDLNNNRCCQSIEPDPCAAPIRTPAAPANYPPNNPVRAWDGKE